MNLIDADSQSFVSPPFFIRSQVTVYATGLAPTDRVEFDMLVLSNPLSDDCACPPLVVQPLSIEATEPLTCCNGPVRITSSRPFVILEGPQGVLVRARLVTSDPGVTVQHVWMEETSTANVTDFMRGCPSECCDNAEDWQPNGHFLCFESDAGMGQHRQMQNPCGLTYWELVLPESDESYYTPTGAQRCVMQSCEGIDVGEGDDVQEQVADPCGNLSWRFLCSVTWDATGNFACIPFGDGDGYHIRREYRNQCGETRWVQDYADGTWQPTGQIRCEGEELFEQQVNACGTMRWESQGAASVVWTNTGQISCEGNEVLEQQTNQCGQTRWHSRGSNSATWEDTGNRRCLYGEYQAQEVNQCGGLRWSALDYETWVATGVAGCSNGKVTVQETNQCGQLRWTQTDVDCETSLEDSSHSASIMGTPASALEGSSFSFVVTVAPTVAGSNLVLQVALSGDEQTDHSYASPRAVTVPVGQTTGSFSVATINDAAGGADKTLTATIQANPRLTSIGTPASVTVQANATADSSHTVSSLTVLPTSADEGTQFCWTLTLDSNVAGSPLTVYASLSGTEQTAHGYSASPLVIPVGQNSGQFCITTIDDSVGGANTSLCLTTVSSARLPTPPSPVCATVVSKAAPAGVLVGPPTFGGGGDCHFRAGHASNLITSQTIQFNTDGTWQVNNGAPGSLLVRDGDWATGAFTASDYEIQITASEQTTTSYIGTGSCPAGPDVESNSYDSGWKSLGNVVSYKFQVSALRVTDCSEVVSDGQSDFHIEIREKLNHANSVEADGYLCATSDNLQ